MAPLSVLLANEPRAYRETIAVALRLLRPHIEVIVSEPETLDDAIVQHMPQIVICSDLIPNVEMQVPAWAVLYPDGSMSAMLHAGSDRLLVAGIDLNGIVEFIDTNSLAETQT